MLASFLDVVGEDASEVAPWLRFLCHEFLAPSTIDAMHAALANRLRGGHRMSGLVVIDGLREIRADNNRITERVLALEQDAVVLPFDALRKTAGTGPGAGRQTRCVER